jgi:hypothetical protein
LPEIFKKGALPMPYQVTLIRDIFAVVLHPEGAPVDPRRADAVAFVCGSLMDPDIAAHVLGRRVAMAPALAAGFSRGYAEVEGKQMHFMRPEPGAVLPGMALLGVGEQELARLEKFEQCPEIRRQIELDLRIGDATVRARTYLQKDF